MNITIELQIIKDPYKCIIMVNVTVQNFRTICNFIN